VSGMSTFVQESGKTARAIGHTRLTLAFAAVRFRWKYGSRHHN
jgi:hypothetical protein